MTDFFLDLWISPDNRYLVLDKDEFIHAITQAWMSSDQRLKAKNELSTLITAIQAQRFPARARLTLSRWLSEPIKLDIMFRLCINK